MVNSLPKPLLGFTLVWMLINVFQSSLTELDPDEAYYWMYSTQLAWGYFDHPPAVALMIRFGYQLFPFELGVRLGSIILNAGTFIILWVLAGKPRESKALWTFMLLAAAMPFLQVYGFVTTPDSPLLFFTALFFLAYQQFLNTTKWSATLLLGLSMALLLYSKYHGVLLIFFTLFSNLKLLLNPRFYLASIFGALLFFPHLWWQYLHDFPSFRYHLEGRDDVYKLKYTTTYLLNQLLIYSPLVFPMILMALRRTRYQQPLFSAFLWNITGFWLFFLWSTTKGHAEPQWTAVLSIPFVLITYAYSLGKPNFTKWLNRMSIATIVLIGIARILLMFNLLGLKNDFNDRAWIPVLKEQANGLPIVLENSYRDISKYNFYSGDRAITVTNYRYRKNQFDIWAYERDLHGKSIFLVLQKDTPCKNCKKLPLPNRNYNGMVVPSYNVAQEVNYQISTPQEEILAGTELRITAKCLNPYEHEIRFYGQDFPLKMYGLYFRNPGFQDTVALEVPIAPIIVAPGEEKSLELVVPVPEYLDGNYDFHLGIRSGPLPPSINSRPFDIEVAGAKK